MTIFTTKKYALYDALETLTEKSITTLVGTTIFKRGQEYYANGSVEDIAYTDIFTIG